jgi:hypothetical protein
MYLSIKEATATYLKSIQIWSYQNHSTMTYLWWHIAQVLQLRFCIAMAQMKDNLILFNMKDMYIVCMWTLRKLLPPLKNKTNFDILSNFLNFFEMYSKFFHILWFYYMWLINVYLFPNKESNSEPFKGPFVDFRGWVNQIIQIWAK